MSLSFISNWISLPRPRLSRHNACDTREGVAVVCEWTWRSRDGELDNATIHCSQDERIYFRAFSYSAFQYTWQQSITWYRQTLKLHGRFRSRETDRQFAKISNRNFWNNFWLAKFYSKLMDFHTCAVSQRLSFNFMEYSFLSQLKSPRDSRCFYLTLIIVKVIYESWDLDVGVLWYTRIFKFHVTDISIFLILPFSLDFLALLISRYCYAYIHWLKKFTLVVQILLGFPQVVQERARDVRGFSRDFHVLTSSEFLAWNISP